MPTPALYVDANIQTAYTRAELLAYAGRAYADLQHYTTFRPQDVDTQFTRMEFQRAILGLRDQLFLMDTVQALVDAATIVWNMASGQNATVTLGGNRTLGAPSNIIAGSSGVLIITQDSGAPRTLAYNAVWKWPVGAPVLQTASGAKDVLYWYSPDGTNCYAVLRGDASNLVTGTVPDARLRAARAGINNSSLGSLNVSDSTATNVLTDTTDYDNDGMVDALNPNALTIKTAGIYQIEGAGNWDANGTGYRTMALYLNGVLIPRAVCDAVPSAAVFNQQVSGEALLAVGDVLKLNVWQNSGGNLNFNAGGLKATRISR